MTYEEKVDDLVNKRGNAIFGVVAIDKEIAKKEDERDFHYEYLFGDLENSGLINLLEVFNTELNKLVGRTTTTPVLHNGINSSKIDWENAFKKGLSNDGDGEDGLYPEGALTQDLNEDSPYFTNNGLDSTNDGGSIATRNSLIIAIGDSADTDTTKTEEDFGIGLIGQRTADNEEIPAVPPFPVTFGNGFPDKPNYYNEPHRSDLLNGITNLINKVDELKNIANLQKGIFEENSKFFIEPELALPVFDDDYITALDGIKTELQIHYDYFNQFTASDDISGQTGYVKATFDTILNDLKTYLVGTFTTTVNGRRDVVLGYNSDTDIRDMIKFWIKQTIGKNEAPLVALFALQDSARPNSLNNLNNASEGLGVLIGEDKYDEFLIRPKIVTVYFNPDIDDEGNIIKKKVTVLFTSSLGANKHVIYRRKISNNILVDDEDIWENEYSSLVEVNEAGMVKNEFTDEDVESGLYIYRVKSFDGEDGAWPRVDSFTSSSLQNKVIGRVFNISSKSGNVLETEEEVEGNFSVCFVDNKYIRVLGINKKKITLSEEITGNEITEINGAIFVS